MTTKTPVKSRGASHRDDLSATDIFSLLGDDRRRNTLHFLSQHVAAISLGELAEQLAVWDDNPTYDRYERVLTSLHQSHLPQLVEKNVVRYDSEQETVTGLDAIDSIRPYLDLAFPDDVR